MQGQKTTQQGNPRKKNPPPRDARLLFIWLLAILAAVYFFQLSKTPLEEPKELDYGVFFKMAQENRISRTIGSADITENIIRGKLADGKPYTVTIPAGDPELIKVLRENVDPFRVKLPRTFLTNLLFTILGPVLFVGLLWLLFYRGASAATGGGRIWTFGKSRARLISPDNTDITFRDVAGVDEAKEELKEVIEFLKDPKKFQRLGGKMPKGILLLGPPGCGKTMLARAAAAEAGVPFFSISGSDFVEMFVGVGASRVRDTFDQAKKAAKQLGKGAIIFIDEIDAVGRQRFAGIGGGHDEREQTLNALLVEMDGFDTAAGTILLAATNRPDVLDPALLRPGRFDRHIIVDRPDIIGREEILKVHTRKVKLNSHVDLKKVAQQTPGFSGADIANLVNEAALLAARRDKENVEMKDLQDAIERVIAGPEKKARVISKDEKKITAYHESGHALLALLVPEADPLHKVSILPRGLALGYTITPPLEDRHIYTKKKLMAEITVALGGRVSEELIFNEISTGAQSDLKVISEKARMMVTRFGMSEKLGHLTFGRPHEEIFLGRDFGEERNYSEATAKLIDDEVRLLVDTAYGKAREVLSRRKELLSKLAEALLEKEVMGQEEVRALLGLGPHEAAQQGA